MMTFDMILGATVEIKTYQTKADGTWNYLIKIDGRVKMGDIGFGSQQWALNAADARLACEVIDQGGAK